VLTKYVLARTVSAGYNKAMLEQIRQREPNQYRIPAALSGAFSLVVLALRQQGSIASAKIPRILLAGMYEAVLQSGFLSRQGFGRSESFVDLPGQ